MNIEEISMEALRIAREIVPAENDYRKQLEATFKMASALAKSFSVGIFFHAIDCLPDLFQESEDVGAISDEGKSGSGIEALPFHTSDYTGGAPNKPLSGKLISTHNSSSSPKDGESVGEVTTPSRTETVAPDTQPVMQPCTHTRTDGEGV